MASNYRRRSSSSGSPSNAYPRGASSATYVRGRGADGRGNDDLISRRIGDIDREDRAKRLRKAKRRWALRITLIVLGLALVAAGIIALYMAPVFKVANIRITGASHLTEQEMLALAQIPDDVTLMQVDAPAIEQNCLRDAWIESVSVNKHFPDTLELVVKERSIAATVAVPTGNSSVTRVWAIASDGTWLMPIPDKESEAAKTVSAQVYADAEAVLQIVDVPYGTKAEIGVACTDSNVNNALAIVSGMTTELADRVVRVSASDAASTILTLDNGVEIAFGTAENIRDKERVCLELLDKYEGTIAYINVRSATNPTWRAV